MLLGPTCLGYFFPGLSGRVFSQEVMPFIFSLSNLGLILYMFRIALEIDFRLFTRSTFRQSFLLTVSATAIPFLTGLSTGMFFFDKLKGGSTSLLTFSLFQGCAIALTAFPVLARILQEKKLIKSRMGAVLLLSASMQDVIAWCLLGFITISVQKGSPFIGTKNIIGMIAFAIILVSGKYILRVLYKRVKAGRLTKQAYSSVVIAFVLTSALMTDHIGLHSVFGAFIFGILAPKNEIIVHELSARLQEVTELLLIPLFFAYAGLKTNLLILGQLNFLLPAIVILLGAFASKYTVTALTMRWSGFGYREASAAGGLMNARGMMELIIANIGLMYGIISEKSYSILILLAISSTMLAMPIYHFSMNFRRKKTMRPTSAPSMQAQESPSVMVKG
ncbi:cation:proton antiporter [Flavitalea sp. BT771]|uniref:cation:proton antiporter domain-containing protein n=1 Tax=Flavitalea sp. BT771 TaxID=3063329 RepID=UPI0039819B1F